MVIVIGTKSKNEKLIETKETYNVRMIEENLTGFQSTVLGLRFISKKKK